jgi:hypothetical protein
VRIQSGVLVPLGYGKYVKSERVTAIVPFEEDRGPGRRTLVYVEGQEEPLVASRAEDSVVRDLVSESGEVVRARQQQEILRDLLDDLSTVDRLMRDFVRDKSRLDLNVVERRIRDALEDASDLLARAA